MIQNILTHITSGRLGRAQKVVIYAPEGFGKSTLAAQFPAPLFLDVEDSTSQLDVFRVGRSALADLTAFESALAEVAMERPCATLVVDTVDWLEQMALEAVVAGADNPKIQGIEDFGYGRGYTMLKERMTILLARLDAVVAAGVHVVLLAHAKVVKFEPPDGAGSFDRFELKLTKHVAPLVKEWADMLLFGNWRTQLSRPVEAGTLLQPAGHKERLMYCNRSDAWDAKNRHGLRDIEKWDIGVIANAFRRVGARWLLTDSSASESASAAASEALFWNGSGNDDGGRGPGGLGIPQGAGGNLPGGGGTALGALYSWASEGQTITLHDTALTTFAMPAAHSEGGEADAALLASVCSPYEPVINAYLLANGRIRPGQSFREVDPTFRTRVLKNPAGFLKVALHGKAVAA